MPIEYSIDRELGIVFRTYTGNITLRDFEKHWRKLLTDPEVPDRLALIADMRECQLMVGGRDLTELVLRVIEPLLRGRRWISAVVVSSKDQFGVTRQFMAYSNKCGETEVFYDMDQAIAWVNSVAAERN